MRTIRKTLRVTISPKTFASDIRRRAGLGPEATPIQMAVAILGAQRVRAVPLRASLGLLVFHEDNWIIAYHPGARCPQTVVAHELGHLSLRYAGVPIGPLEERRANAVAKALGFRCPKYEPVPRKVAA